eukprot:gene3555-6290_t
MKKTFQLFLTFFLFYVINSQHQVRIQFTGKSNKYSISWQSKNQEDAAVRFGYNPNNLNENSIGKTTKFIACVLYSSITKEAEITVRENVPVFFQVKVDSQTWSKTYSFQSAPQNIEEFNFIAYGDTDSTQYSELVMQKIIKDEKSSAFVLHAGDFAYDSPMGQEEWDKWGKMYEPLTSSKPLVAVVGNHEFHCLWRFENFKNRFTTKLGENSGGDGNFYYSMKYGNVLFFILSSEHTIDEPSAQYQWFEKELSKVDRTQTPWIIVSYHQPAYSSVNGFGRYPGSTTTRNLEPLFSKYKVNLVIAGHDHCYERTCNVNNFKCGNELGLTHLTIGTAGRRLYGDFKMPKPEWIVYREATYGYARISVSKTQLGIQYIRLNGTIGDTHIIRQ